MEITETGGIHDIPETRISLNEYDVENLFYQGEINKIKNTSPMLGGNMTDCRITIEINHLPSIRISEWERIEPDEVFDDSLDALGEVIKAFEYLQKNVVKRDAHKSYYETMTYYDIEKAVKTYKFYNNIRSEYE